MTYTVEYGENAVKEDIPNLAKTQKVRIKRAIDSKLLNKPEVFGKPLRKSLAGFRKLRVGDYRVIFEIDVNRVIVWTIGHRRDIYEVAKKRL